MKYCKIDIPCYSCNELVLCTPMHRARCTNCEEYICVSMDSECTPWFSVHRCYQVDGCGATIVGDLMYCLVKWSRYEDQVCI